MNRSPRDPHRERVMRRAYRAVAESTPPLPGTCSGCRVRVFLYGMVWCDENGVKHECAA